MGKNNKKPKQLIRVFVSCPMSGRTDNDILADIKRLGDIAKEKLYNDLTVEEAGDFEIGIVHNFRTELEEDALTRFNAKYAKHGSLVYLGQAIEKMANCDFMIIEKESTKARGCSVEFMVALRYGLNVIYINDNGVNYVLPKDKDNFNLGLNSI